MKMGTLDPMALGKARATDLKKKRIFLFGAKGIHTFLIQGELRSYLAKCTKGPVQDDLCRSLASKIHAPAIPCSMDRGAPRDGSGICEKLFSGVSHQTEPR